MAKKTARELIEEANKAKEKAAAHAQAQAEENQDNVAAAPPSDTETEKPTETPAAPAPEAKKKKKTSLICVFTIKEDGKTFAPNDEYTGARAEYLLQKGSIKEV